VFDCTTRLDPTPPARRALILPVACRDASGGPYPRRRLLDLQGEFSDTGTHLHFMMPSAAHLMAAFGRTASTRHERCALYSSGTMMWATRLCSMLR